ncbi:MAG: hypothetical protein RI894_192 [Bacteroidota bacterium]|jgi:hypothetical protein
MKNKPTTLITLLLLGLFTAVGWAQNKALVQPFAPTNGAEVREEQPLFTWTCPPVGDLAKPIFTLVLVAKQAEQSPEIAMASNPIVARQKGMLTAQWLYDPSVAGELKPCQEYAWQVEAIDPQTGKLLAKSAIWTFTVGCQTTKTVALVGETFIALEDEAHYPYRSANILRISFNNPYDSSGFDKITLLDNKGNDVKAVIAPEYLNVEQREVVAGKNWVRLILPTTLVEAQFYSLTFSLKNGLNKTIPFVYFSK